MLVNLWLQKSRENWLEKVDAGRKISWPTRESNLGQQHAHQDTLPTELHPHPTTWPYLSQTQCFSTCLWTVACKKRRQLTGEISLQRNNSLPYQGIEPESAVAEPMLYPLSCKLTQHLDRTCHKHNVFQRACDLRFGKSREDWDSCSGTDLSLLPPAEACGCWRRWCWCQSVCERAGMMTDGSRTGGSSSAGSPWSRCGPSWLRCGALFPLSCCDVSWCHRHAVRIKPIQLNTLWHVCGK